MQSHFEQQRQHLRRQIRLTATLECTCSPVTSVVFVNGPPCICGEPPVNISTTLLESKEVSAVPAEVLVAKTNVEESPFAANASCYVGTTSICSEPP